jgi:hypothetical protein
VLNEEKQNRCERKRKRRRITKRRAETNSVEENKEEADRRKPEETNARGRGQRRYIALLRSSIGMGGR